VIWCSFFALVLFHELGHAFVVQRVHARATSVEVHAFGGLCRWRGEVTPLARAAIAWGGIWAQMIVLAVTGLWAMLAGPARSDAEWQVRAVFLGSNLWMIAFNLLPIPPQVRAEEHGANLPFRGARLDRDRLQLPLFRQRHHLL